jgi:class 3 adenylate cyclase
MLRTQLHSMTVPVMLADANPIADPDQVTPEQAAFLTKFRAAIDNPLVRPALVRLARDSDETIRRVPGAAGPGADGATIAAFADALAASKSRPPLQGGQQIAYYGDFGRPSYFRGFKPGAVAANESFPYLMIPADPIVGAGKPAWDALLRPQLAGKIVLVGIYVRDIDRLPTPFTVINGVAAPGVLIHASLVAQMLDGRWIRVPSVLERGLISILLVGAGFTIGLRSNNNWLTLGLLSAVVFGYWSLCVLAYAVPVDHGLGRSLYPMISPAVAAMVATALGYAFTRQRFQAQRNFIEGALGKYVSPSVAEQLLAHPDLLRVGGERRVVTVMFTDIEGFTSLSESLEPVKLVEILNKYLDGMTRIVHDFEGTLDKYIGDALVALWNAPIERIDHATMAVGCAVALDEFAERFAIDQRAAGIPFGRTRIGVQTGLAIVGNFGGEEKLNYTAIGDTVNLASRLEGANKYLGTRVLVGKDTALASAREDLRPVADLVVKGREEAVAVFEPVPLWDPARLDRFRKLYAHIHAGGPAVAEEVEALATDLDPVILLYANRLRSGQSGTRIVLEDK